MKLGNLVLAAFDGPALSDAALHHAKKDDLQNFILFTKNKNYENPAQLIALNSEIQFYSKKLPAIISVDQEGGRVARFRDGFTRLPAAGEVGKLSAKEIRKIVQVQASELFAAGLNLNFAPCADIHTNPENPIIGDRSYGTTAAQCSKAVKIVVEGHLKAKVMPCVKHFPGHGDTSVDSHLHLPNVSTSLKTLFQRELKPFQAAIKAKVPCLMTAHIIVPSIDAEYPGTLSPDILSIARKKLGFRGIIFSDDFQMKAIADHFGYEDAIRRAMLAGCDVISTNTWDGTMAALQTLQKLVHDKKLPKKLLEDKIKRVQTFRKKLKLPKEKLPVRLAAIGNEKNLAAVWPNSKKA